MKKHRSIVGKAGLLLGGLAVAGLLLEGLIRLIFADTMVLFPRYHTAAQYGDFTLRRLRPNIVFRHRSPDGAWTFTINSRGFRAAREYAYAKPPGTVRVLCVGDSHTQGFECRQDQTYAAVIEDCLNRQGVPAEVLNAGVSGFSTAEELVFVENEGVRYAPDVVVVGFYANDLEDNLKADLFRLQAGQLVVHRTRHVPGVEVLDVVERHALLRWLGQHSYAYSLLFNTIWDSRKRLLLTRAEQAAVTEYAVPQADTDRALAQQKNELCGALIQRLHAFCRARQITLVILDIPQLGPDGRGFQSSIPPALEPLFARHADILLRSPEVLAGTPDPDGIFVPHGHRHISESTHAALGQAVAAAILERPRAAPPGIPSAGADRRALPD